MTTPTFTFKSFCQFKGEAVSADTYIPAGYIVRSRNPVIQTKRFDTPDQAWEAYQEQIKTWVKRLIPTGTADIEIDDPVYSGKTDLCTNESGLTVLKCDPKDVRITWTVTVKNPVNHSLSEYTPGLGVPEENV